MFYLGIEDRRRERENRSRLHLPCRICTREKNNARKQPRQDYLDALKIERGCVDCLTHIPHPEIYDFDHVRGVKIKTVSAFLTSGTWDDMLDEVAKCEVVCSNCHRIRTREREKPAFGRSK